MKPMHLAARRFLVFALLCFHGSVASGRLLDDFEDGVKRTWSEFVFGVGGSIEAGGILQLELASTYQQPVLAAAIYEAETFPLTNAATLEFRADLVEANSSNIYSMVAWVPKSNSVARLAGYFVSVSGKEVRIGKGYQKYFWRQELLQPLRQSGLTLALSLEHQGSSVKIRAQVLDKENNDAVVFDRSVLDTGQADSLQVGADTPAGFYEGEGRLVLVEFLEQPENAPEQYTLKFDNVTVSLPVPTNNLPPFLIPVRPRTGESFVPSFEGDPEHFIVDFILRDENPGLFTGYASGARFVALGREADGKGTYVSCLTRYVANTNMTVLLTGLDGAGGSNTLAITFDTFSLTNPVIEMENYDFGGGQFIDEPLWVPEGIAPRDDAYLGQAGVAGEDYYDLGMKSGAPYRPSDKMGILRGLDYLRPQYRDPGPADGFYDYAVHDIQAEEFRNYTRTFPKGSYEIYLRQALIGVGQAEAALERRVTSAGQTNRTFTVVGWFRAENTGFEFQNVPLTDSDGRTINLRLAGKETLRLRQLSAVPSRGDIHQNYLVFVPQVEPGVILETATNVAGPYRSEPSARYDESRGVITASLPADPVRFYRVRSSKAWRIERVEIVSGELALRIAPGG